MDLKTGDKKNFVNFVKPLRLSEMYLISAEADARMGNNNPARLNEFCANRYSGYETQTYDNAQKLLDEVLVERDKVYWRGYALERSPSSQHRFRSL